MAESGGIIWETETLEEYAILTIKRNDNPESGTPGVMPDYESFGNTPWIGWTGKLDSFRVVIEEGVEVIGTYAFASDKVDGTLTIPVGMTHINSNAFYGCYKISKITFNSKPRIDESEGTGSFVLNPKSPSKTYTLEGSGIDSSYLPAYTYTKWTYPTPEPTVPKYLDKAGLSRFASKVKASLGQKSKVEAVEDPEEGSTLIKGMSVDGTTYKFAGGDSSVVSFDVSLEVEGEHQGQITGEVTEEQYNAIKNGGKLVSANINVGGNPYAIATGGVFVLASDGTISGYFSYEYEDYTVSVAQITIKSDFSVTGTTTARAGHRIKTSTTAYESGSTIKGIKLDGGEYNFPEGASLVDIEATLDDTGKILSGTVTQTQFDALKAGASALATIKIGDQVVSKAIGSTCASIGGGEKWTVAISLICNQGGTSTRMCTVAYMVINEELTISGYISEVGNDIAFNTSEATGAQLVRSVTLNETALNFSHTVTAVIGTTWTASEQFSTQEVEITGISENDTPIVSVIYDGYTPEEVATQKTEAAKIFKIETTNGKLNVYATAATTVDLTIQVKVV